MGFNLFNEVTMMTRLRTINRGMLEGMCYVWYAPPPPSTLDTFPYKSAPPKKWVQLTRRVQERVKAEFQGKRLRSGEGGNPPSSSSRPRGTFHGSG